MINKLKNKINSFFTSLGVKIKEAFNKFLDTYDKSNFKKVLIKIFKYIGIGLYYIFWPICQIKKRWYDKLRFDQQKVVVSFIFLFPVLFGFVVFFVYPLIMSLIYSFSTVTVNPTEGLRFYFGKYVSSTESYTSFFHNYSNIMSKAFLEELWLTCKDTFLNTVVITIFSLMIAVMLNGNFKGRGFARAVFFLPVIFNSDAIDVAMSGAEAVDAMLNAAGGDALLAVFDIKTFFTSIGIPLKLVTFLGDITNAIYSTISYSGVQILIFLAAIQSVPTHLYEAAKIEGATKYESFWKITLPMVSPMISTVVVYTIVDSFLRSDINDLIENERIYARFGQHAAMSWIYILASMLILGFFMLILRKVVFYNDEKQ